MVNTAMRIKAAGVLHHNGMQHIMRDRTKIRASTANMICMAQRLGRRRRAATAVEIGIGTIPPRRRRPARMQTCIRVPRVASRRAVYRAQRVAVPPQSPALITPAMLIITTRTINRRPTIRDPGQPMAATRALLRPPIQHFKEILFFLNLIILTQTTN